MRKGLYNNYIDLMIYDGQPLELIQALHTHNISLYDIKEHKKTYLKLQLENKI
ncbi:hypothetical protein [Halalkalibacillus halophilus]|uniref:hypothetical protein n=1 Tax=Halalkalibacillus halophilus TaxID=392827 RepID=UPI000417F5B2|nr:hypothetical protein [Halalkalibacillus halophilus]